MGDHSRGVTRKYMAVENSLDEGYWDDVFRELSYFEGQEEPFTEKTRSGREVGEFDVLAVNYEDQRFLYVEVKTNWGDLKKAWNQLERSNEFFDEWDMIGQTYLED
jgi:hypothetical protein